LTTKTEKPKLCTNCWMPVTFTDADRADNNARLKEQAEIRKKDESFNFRFRATCANCGTVYFDQIIKNVRMKTC